MADRRWSDAFAGIRGYYVEPRALAQFVADDPWTARTNVDWVLVLYLLSESITGPDAAVSYARRHYRKDDLPGPGQRDFAFAEIAALERHDDPMHPIFMPHALARVWQQGECPAASLPRVLHALQPTLIRSDTRFADLMTGGGRYRFGLIAYGVLALLFVVLDLTFRPPGFNDSGHFLLWLALFPALMIPAMVLFRRWLLHRRARLEALCRAIAATAS